MTTDIKELAVAGVKSLKKGPQAIMPLAHGSSEMADLLSRHESAFLPLVGDLVSGKVPSISKNGVVLDIDGRLTGLVRGKELDDESGEYSKLAIGDGGEATL